MSGVREFLAQKRGHNSGAGRWRGWGRLFAFCPCVRMDALAYSVRRMSGAQCFSEVDGRKVYIVENRPVLIDVVCCRAALGATVTSDFRFEDCVLRCYEGVFGFGSTSHEAFRDAQDRAWRRVPLERRIEKVKRKYPRLDSAATWGEWCRVHTMLTGSCEAGKQIWLEKHGHNTSHVASMEEFLTETASDYGNENIKKLREAYERD